MKSRVGRKTVVLVLSLVVLCGAAIGVAFAAWLGSAELRDNRIEIGGTRIEILGVGTENVAFNDVLSPGAVIPDSTAYAEVKQTAHVKSGQFTISRSESDIYFSVGIHNISNSLIAKHVRIYCHEVIDDGGGTVYKRTPIYNVSLTSDEAAYGIIGGGAERTYELAAYCTAGVGITAEGQEVNFSLLVKATEEKPMIDTTVVEHTRLAREVLLDINDPYLHSEDVFGANGADITAVTDISASGPQGALTYTGQTGEITTALTANGLRTWKVESEAYGYIVQAYVADIVIRDETDLKTFFGSYPSDPGSLKNVLTDKFVVLANDITYTDSGALTRFHYNNVFNGTFDGRGYTIYNVKITRTLFNYIGRAGGSVGVGAVKNLSLINVIETSGAGRVSLICDTLSPRGSVENVYVHSTQLLTATTKVDGIANTVDATGVVIKNCIVFVESNYATRCGISSSTNGTIENCFVISSTIPTLSNSPNITNSLLRTSTSALLAEEPDFSGFTGYWQVEDGRLPMLSSYHAAQQA